MLPSALLLIRKLREQVDILSGYVDSATNELETAHKKLENLADLAKTWRIVGDNYSAIQYEHAAAAIEQLLKP